MSVQPSLAATNDGIVGTARAALSDPDDVVARIEFFITVLPNGTRMGPFVPDRTVAYGEYELDVLLDPSGETSVEAVAVLTDDTTVPSSPPSVTLPVRSATPPPPALGALRASAEWWKVEAQVVPAAAASWKCWMRRGAWPTLDNTPEGELLEEFLHFEGDRDSLSFSQTIPPGEGVTYCFVAIGYDGTGQPGPRLTDTVDTTYGPPVRGLIRPHVLQVDGIEHRMVTAAEKLAEFTDWLTQHNQRGFISEVGWPVEAADAWNEVAAHFCSLANQHELWIASWAVGEWWGSYKLQPYKRDGQTYVTQPQHTVLEIPANLTTPQYKRGVNVAGAEFGTPVTQPRVNWFSNVNRGVHGTEYIWNHDWTYQYMAARGHVLARIPFRWERIQPTLGAALDSGELQLMSASIDTAIAAGMEVILDVHNYGAYYLHDAATGEGVRRSIGTSHVTFEHFADLWQRLAEVFNSYPGVIGYGLMNEPVDMEAVQGLTADESWETAAQQAVAAIRGVALPPGAEPKWVIVGGHRWGGTWTLSTLHRDPFIDDPADRVLYEAHHYFDYNNSGAYSQPELSPVREENWVRWEPNVAMWSADRGGNPHVVEVVRVGDVVPIAAHPLWRKGAVDEPVFPCTPGEAGCGHRTYEYRIIATDTRDGSVADYATSISGPYAD